METIQVVLDAKLLRAADRAARRTKLNRSALIRDALREHLRRMEMRALEEQERAAYARLPQNENELLAWDPEAVWPEK
jgi:metal-responsive CopG/Arc/MetJ family transcriptional regulator